MKTLHTKHGGNFLAWLNVFEEVDKRLAFCFPSSIGDLPNFEPVAPTEACEDHEVVMGGSNVDVFERIAFPFHIEASNALASPFLLTEGIDWHALNVIVFRDRDDDGLIWNEVFHLELAFGCDDLSSALAFVVLAELFELFLDDAADEEFAS